MHFMKSSGFIIVVAYVRDQGLRIRWKSLQIWDICSSIFIATTTRIAQTDELTQNIMLSCSALFIVFKTPSRFPYGSTWCFRNTELPSIFTAAGFTAMPLFIVILRDQSLNCWLLWGRTRCRLKWNWVTQCTQSVRSQAERDSSQLHHGWRQEFLDRNSWLDYVKDFLGKSRFATTHINNE